MTVSTEVDQWNDDEGVVGLEDIDAGDLFIPRLQLKHKLGVFKDSLSGWESEKLTCIMLGVVKQRIMWPDDQEDDAKPQCKSTEFSFGFPNMREDLSVDKRFPWAESNFSPSDAVPVEIGPRTDPAHPDGWSSNGFPVLACSACKFKDWSKNGSKSVPPPCTEQHTYPVLYLTDDETWNIALLTLQRTGIKPSKSYISSFAGAKKPMFTAITEITLSQQSRGTVEYCVPNLKRVGDTDPSQWGEYAERFRGIRTLIRQAPRRADDDTEAEIAVPSANVNTAPAAAAPAAQEAVSTPAPTPPPTPT